MANKAVNGKKHGPAYDILRAIVSNKVTVVCLIIVAILLFLSVSADLLFDYSTDVIGQNPAEALQSPNASHWFGTDKFGRDYFARILYATRATLIIALSGTAIGMVVSIILGGLVAYYGGVWDTVLMRILDILLSVPQTLFVICVVAVLGNSQINIILTFALISLPGMTRMARASFLMSMQNEYVEAAKACGTGNLEIIFGHLLPNSLGPIIVDATMSIGGCLLSTAGLGYLGLGIPAPAPEWGRMLAEAQEYMRSHLYLILIPGLFILISVTAFNLLGDGLRDAMDPRLRGYRKTRKRWFSKKSNSRRAS